MWVEEAGGWNVAHEGGPPARVSLAGRPDALSDVLVAVRAGGAPQGEVRRVSWIVHDQTPSFLAHDSGTLQVVRIPRRPCGRAGGGDE